MADDLASGFQDVDRAANFAVFSSCLTLMESIPFFAKCNRESFGMLGASPGRRILDVGCGLGDDAAAMARLVAAGGTVVGVDGSQAMIEAARARHGGVDGLSFEFADAAHLPFDDASFDACRIDRVLQHIANPAAVVARDGPRIATRRRAGGIRQRLGDPHGRLGRSGADARRPERLVRPLPLRLDRPATRPASSCGPASATSSRSRRPWCSASWTVADRIYCFIATVERAGRCWSRQARKTRDAGRPSCAPPMWPAASSARTPVSWYAEFALARRTRHSDRDVQAGVFLPQAPGHDHGRVHRLLRESAFAAV